MDNQELTNPNNGGTNGAGKEKKGIVQAFAEGYQKVKANKFGRWAIRLTKWGAWGGSIYGAVKYGQKHAPVTTVYVREGVEETSSEPSEETQQEAAEE